MTKKSEQYFWMDDSDCVAVGSYSTAQEAIETALAMASEADCYTREYTILKAVSVSPPPSLKRVWKPA